MIVVTLYYLHLSKFQSFFTINIPLFLFRNGISAESFEL